MGKSLEWENNILNLNILLLYFLMSNKKVSRRGRWCLFTWFLIPTEWIILIFVIRYINILIVKFVFRFPSHLIFFLQSSSGICKPCAHLEDSNISKNTSYHSHHYKIIRQSSAHTISFIINTSFFIIEKYNFTTWNQLRKLLRAVLWCGESETRPIITEFT